MPRPAFFWQKPVGPAPPPGCEACYHMLPFRANYLSGRVIGGTLKDGIHPNYVESKVICSCGETFTTHSTLPEIKVEVCAACHPFYTGKQKLVDSGGRVERFNKKYRRTEQAK